MNKRCDARTTDLTEGMIWCQLDAGHDGNHRWTYTVEWPNQWNAPSEKRP